MRWIILTLTATILGAGILAAAWHTHTSNQQQQRFLQWETCTLNDQPHCGPQPVP